MEQALSILQQYWQYPGFRPGQEEIIASVLEGRDTLALLPTGGGKSICFQVPALVLDGICIVITPLIALMKDQVEQLRKREIQAVAIHSGLRKAEIDILLDNCIYGQIKFLYVSPERLHTELFVARVKQMKVSLIAVDEAHCISQWGYDFRPSYMRVTGLRELLPQVPVIALTATATPIVRQDIVEKLAFRQPMGVFQQSFARANLSLVVRKAENKEQKLLEILRKVPGPAILYVRSRKATQEISEWLVRRNIAASYYHAGLDFEERGRRQDDWIKNRTRVIVATNAFGMGIDKPDVRLVVHLDLPENIESYYQEAGRAGRDGQRSFATILYQDGDITSLQFKVTQNHPPPEVLRRTYQALANYYQLAIGSGEGQSYDFDLHDFADRFQFQQAEVYVALKKLEEEGLIQFTESFYNPSHLHFLMDKTRLYEFQIANARFDPFIKMLLRLYGGELFTGFVRISEAFVARAMSAREGDTRAVLQHLDSLKVVIYQPLKDKPQVTFILPRQDADRLPLDLGRLETRKKLALDKVQAITHYAQQTERCRMVVMQEYFGEEAIGVCGLCDVCLAQRKEQDASAVEELHEEILNVLRAAPMSMEELEERIAPRDRELFVDIVRELVDGGRLAYDEAWKLRHAR